MPLELIIATISIGMKAVELWHKSKDRDVVSNKLKEAKKLQYTPEIQNEAREFEQLLIPKNILDGFKNRIKRCWDSYAEIVNSPDYLPQEVEEASKAVISCVCRELLIIHGINRSIPPAKLSEWWENYRCLDRKYD